MSQKIANIHKIHHNIVAHPIPSSFYSLLKTALNKMVSRISSQTSSPLGNGPLGSFIKLEPTPIDPHGVVPVDSVPLVTSSLVTDDKMISMTFD